MRLAYIVCHVVCSYCCVCYFFLVVTLAIIFVDVTCVNDVVAVAVAGNIVFMLVALFQASRQHRAMLCVFEDGAIRELFFARAMC